jgi:hypothetical protein
MNKNQSAAAVDDSALNASTASLSLLSKSNSWMYDHLLLRDSMFRKDQTMVHVLQVLRRIEHKFDTLGVSKPTAPASDIDHGMIQSRAFAIGANKAHKMFDELHVSSNSSEVRLVSGIESHSSSSPCILSPYQHLTVAHKVLLWPSIYLHILNSEIAVAADLQDVFLEGTPWLVRLELHKHPQTLLCDTDMATSPVPNGTDEIRAGFMKLTRENVRRMSDAYFNAFNVLLPILNRQMFSEDILEPILRNGFVDCDSQGCLVLLVLALGQAAIDGVYDSPISIVEGNPSGLRGGTAERPPGLDLFNEARRRIGFITHQCTLENVQIHLLES